MSRRLKVAAVLGALGVLGVVGCGFRGYLAGVFPSAPAEIHDIKLPPGFRIAVYAADVPNARQMALGPPGIVFVGSRDEGKVHAVVDRDGDIRCHATLRWVRRVDARFASRRRQPRRAAG